MMELVIAYFDWDIDIITEIVTLPIDQSRYSDFIKCVQEQEANDKENADETDSESQDDGSKKKEL